MLRKQSFYFLTQFIKFRQPILYYQQDTNFYNIIKTIDNSSTNIYLFQQNNDQVEKKQNEEQEKNQDEDEDSEDSETSSEEEDDDEEKGSRFKRILIPLKNLLKRA